MTLDARRPTLGSRRVGRRQLVGPGGRATSGPRGAPYPPQHVRARMGPLPALRGTIMNVDDRRRGGKMRAASLTADERRDAGRRAYLAGAVNTVCRRIEDLTTDQKDRLRAALALATKG